MITNIKQNVIEYYKFIKKSIIELSAYKLALLLSLLTWSTVAVLLDPIMRFLFIVVGITSYLLIMIFHSLFKILNINI